MGRMSKNFAEAISLSKPIWNCGNYYRLSKEDGDKLESDSIDSQQKIVGRYLEKNPDLIAYDNYVDDGYTGTNFERPNFKRLIQDIKARRVNCIIVKDLSRFGRDMAEVTRYLDVIVPLLKIRFISINDRIDSFKIPSSLDNIGVKFKVVMNDEYCRDTSNKIKRSLTAKRKKGQFIGSFASYGYDKDINNKNKLIIDEEAASTVRLIFKLFVGGKSMHAIHRMLNSDKILSPSEYKKSKGLNVNHTGSGKWNYRTIQRILKNEMYLGHMVQKVNENISYKIQKCRGVSKEKRIIVHNTHEPIIDFETFNKVQDLLKRDTKQSYKEPTVSIFAGFLKCADCKRGMYKRTITHPNKTYYYYKCSGYDRLHECSKHFIQMEALEKSVLTTIQKYIEIAIDMEDLINVINNSTVRNNASNQLIKVIQDKEREQNKIKKILLDLYPDFKNGLLSKESYLKLKEDNEIKLDSVSKALIILNQELDTEQNGTHDSNDFISSFKRHKNITSLSREVIVELINMIYVEEGGGINIEFKFNDAYQQAVRYIAANKAIVEEHKSSIKSAI